jgi:hypothetical protein
MIFWGVIMASWLWLPGAMDPSKALFGEKPWIFFLRRNMNYINYICDLLIDNNSVYSRK